MKISFCDNFLPQRAQRAVEENVLCVPLRSLRLCGKKIDRGAPDKILEDRAKIPIYHFEYRYTIIEF
jgi:hypothetical protein